MLGSRPQSPNGQGELPPRRVAHREWRLREGSQKRLSATLKQIITRKNRPARRQVPNDVSERQQIRKCVGFCQDDEVCRSELTCEYRSRARVGSAGLKRSHVDEGHDSIEDRAVGIGNGLRDSHGIRDAAGFDHDGIRQSFPRADLFEGGMKIRLERAACTPILELDRLGSSGANQRCIDVDRGDVVHQGGNPQRSLLEKTT